jgi:hypothetical protein
MFCLGLAGGRSGPFQLGKVHAQSPEVAEMVSARDANDSSQEGVTAGVPIPAGKYLLVSSFLCYLSNCQYVDAVLRFNANAGPNYGRFEGIHVSNVNGPQGLAVHPTRGTLLVVSYDDDAVYEYNLNTGAPLGTFIQSGQEGIFHPNSIVFNAAGDALVNSIPGQFNLDKLNGIARFNGNTGALIDVFKDGGPIKNGFCGDCVAGPMESCLCGPTTMVIGNAPNRNLFVASALNHRVMEYNGATGAFVGQFANPKMLNPVGLAIRPPGMTGANNVLATSKFKASANDAHKVVEFNGATRQLITTPATNPGVIINVLDEPGPLLWELNGSNINNSTLFVSDRFFWDQPFTQNQGCSYSDRIRRYHATTNQFCTTATCEPDVPSPQNAQFFTWTLDVSAQSQVDCRLHWNAGMVLVDIGCDEDADCFDDNICTDDVCDVQSHTCMNPANNTPDPDDGLFCNGVEDRCENGAVVYQVPPPNCADNLTCTTDFCNESSDACVNQLQAGQCLISGICRDNGAINPSNNCQECDAANPMSWTNSVVGTRCGDQTNNDCDRPNSCNGSGTCLANYEPLGAPCGNNTVTTCTAADTCSGAGICRANNSADGISCSDGLRCTVNDRCFSGACTSTISPCTDPRFPYCIEGAGSFQCGQCLEDAHCPQNPASCNSSRCLVDVYTCFDFPDDANCVDNLFCNGVETCNGSTGLCQPGPKPCVNKACDENANACVDCDDNGDCNDGLFCNGVETCVSGDCRPGTAVNCSSLNSVCRSGICDEALDGCVTVPANEGGVCDDANPCTPTDRCASGTCAGSGTPPDCDDGNLCTTDTCHPTLGCQHTNNTVPCNDDNPCTANDRCSGGTCSGGTATDCNDNNPCTADSCHPILGCRYANASGSCNDNNVCTVNDVCFGGICVGGQVINCSDNNACTTDTCDAVLGCRHANNANACDDGDGCTVGDACSDGRCTAGTPMNCDDNNPCTNDSCNGGACQHANNTVTCSDGNPCTTNDRCGDGRCSGISVSCPPGTSCDMRDGVCRQCITNADCNDNNPCTDEICNGGVCQRTDNTNSCSDGLACTTNDLCSAGVCRGTTVSCPSGFSCDPADGICKDCLSHAECNDGNACSIDTCSGGTCQFANKPGACDDGNPCTTNDSCANRVCTGISVPCPPGQSCDVADGVCKQCRNASDCDDQDACTNDLCLANLCFHDRPQGQCSDGDPCTVDSCLPQTGVCDHEPRGCVFGDISSPTDCLVNESDFLCVLDSFKRGVSFCPDTDVYPCDAADGVTMDDVVALLEAQSGSPPCPDPVNCR